MAVSGCDVQHKPVCVEPEPPYVLAEGDYDKLTNGNVREDCVKPKAPAPVAIAPASSSPVSHPPAPEAPEPEQPVPPPAPVFEPVQQPFTPDRDARDRDAADDDDD